MFASPMKKKQAERRWTVMLVPHGSGSSRAVEVSQTVVKALVGIGSVVALLFLVLGGTALSRGVNVTRSRALERENALLASEIQRMRERLVGLSIDDAIAADTNMLRAAGVDERSILVSAAMASSM